MVGQHHAGWRPVPFRALMLHADPQLVHLREVQKQKLQGVIDAAAFSLIV
jgi:hypothetical protein